MAHGFKNLGASTTFASRKELAWHKLGKTVEAMTSKEAIILGGMDFEVGLAPMSAKIEQVALENTYEYPDIIRNGVGADAQFHRTKEVKGKFSTYRKDTGDLFGVVGARYEPIQNIEAFDFFDEIIGEGHAAYETVGALGNGEKVFLTAKIPDKMLVGKEHIDKYLVFTMAHDGTGSVMIMFTPIRVVCNNTLSAAIGSATNKVSIMHTKNARKRIEDSKRVLGIIQNNGMKIEEVFNRMNEVKVTDQQVGEVIINSYGFTPDAEGFFSTKAKNKFEDIMKYYEIGVGQEHIKGTAWGAYNAITGYQQNVQSYKDDDTHFNNIFSKGASDVRQKAFNELVQIIR
jgi:phage/plasmid-like protein (TIGR03299 family)